MGSVGLGYLLTCVQSHHCYIDFSACLFPGAPNGKRLLLLGNAVKLCNEAVSVGLSPWIFPPAGILVNKTLSMWLVGISPLNTMGQGPQLFSLPSFLGIRNVVAAGIGTQRDL